jgi:hypothetical protein
MPKWIYATEQCPVLKFHDHDKKYIYEAIWTQTLKQIWTNQKLPGSNGNHQYKLWKIELPQNTGLILAEIRVLLCTGKQRNVAKVGIFQGRGARNLARRTITTCVQIVLVPREQHQSRRTGWSPGAALVTITPAGWLSPASAWRPGPASRRRSGGATPEPVVCSTTAWSSPPSCSK